MNEMRDGKRRAAPRAVSMLLLGTFALQGCYSVKALEPGGPQPGARVVASLTPDGSQQLASQVGPRVVAVEGVLDEATASALSLRLVRTEGANSVSTYWNQEEVTVPRPAIAMLRERRLDRPRSFAMAAAIVGAALVAATLASGAFSGDDGGGTNPPPAN
jgi:hypothetical protein